MKNKSLLLSIAIVVLVTGMLSCGKKDTASNVNDPSFKESFDSLNKAVSKGWIITNNSRPIGTVPWVQGFFYLSQHHKFDVLGGPVNTYYLDGMTGMDVSYEGSDFAMTTADCGHTRAAISNWLISPEVEVKNGDIISFYTRTVSNPAQSADRLQVRINPVNSSADVGIDAVSVGNFSNLVLDINPNYILEGKGSYPDIWTPYSITVTGMPGSTAKKSRIALRYFVEDGGPAGTNSVGIGVDQFNFVSVATN